MPDAPNTTTAPHIHGIPWLAISAEGVTVQDAAFEAHATWAVLHHMASWAHSGWDDAHERQALRLISLLEGSGDADPPGWQAALQPLLTRALTEMHTWVPGLVAAGLDVNREDQGETPLMLAARHLPSAIPLFLKAGARPQAQNEQGCTALMRLTQNPNVTPEQGAAAIAQLVVAGADLEARIHQSHNTALWLAILERSPLVPALLAAGADPNAQSSSGHSLLMGALAAKSIHVDALIAAGSDVNFVTPKRTTPLMMAARASARAIAPLLAAGAIQTLESQDSDGDSALMMLMRNLRSHSPDGNGPLQQAMAPLATGGRKDAFDAFDALLNAGVDTGCLIQVLAGTASFRLSEENHTLVQAALLNRTVVSSPTPPSRCRL